MRNAYLLSALVVFPYAVYHLVPGAWAGLAWVGVALLYYGMNLMVRNRKYRWMGHATLLFTAALPARRRDQPPRAAVPQPLLPGPGRGAC